MSDGDRMSTRKQVWTFVALFAVAILIYYPFSPGGRQHANMRKASQHIATLQPALSADPRFRDVKLWPFTGEGGSLYVGGEVDHEADAEAVRLLVNRSRPPVPVVFHVFPRDATVIRPATQAIRP